ncbi:MAG: hypothetical protein IPJ39_22185 [Saprospiraceae bacterium]|nr:hypothetical protein [Saprospiraceae bacterium]
MMELLPILSLPNRFNELRKQVIKLKADKNLTIWLRKQSTHLLGMQKPADQVEQ